VPPAPLSAWIKALGWEALVNRKGTTWRKLDAKRQAAVKDGASARELMLEQPSVIRRPVVEWSDGQVSAGFDPDDWKKRD
jgi:arsenate reductase-like glutaredoxin family protein